MHAQTLSENNELIRPEFWDNAFLRTPRFYLEPSLAAYREEELLHFLKKCTNLSSGIVLKTDSFEESFGNRGVLDWFASSSLKVIGLDLSLAILNTARKKLDNEKYAWILTDISRMPFTDNSLDIIFSTNTYGYLKDVVAGLNEAHRILNPKGTLIISIRNKRNIFTETASFLRKNKFPASASFTTDDFKNKLENSGFAVKKHDFIVHIPVFINPLMSFIENKKSLFFRLAGSVLMRAINKFSESYSFLRNYTGWFIIYLAQKK